MQDKIRLICVPIGLLTLSLLLVPPAMGRNGPAALENSSLEDSAFERSAPETSAPLPAALDRLKAQTPTLHSTQRPGFDRATAVLGLDEGPFEGSPEQAARAFLQTFLDLLPRPLDELELRWIAPLGPAGEAGYGPRGAVVRFRQRLAGQPVDGDGVIITLTPDGRVRAFRQRLVQPISSPTPQITEAQALATARTRRSFTRAHAQLIWLPLAGSARLVWALYPTDSPPGVAVRILVDAETGAISRIENRAINEVGPQADVYLTNPYLEPEPTRVDLASGPLPTLEDALIGLNNCVDQGELVDLLGGDGKTYSSHVCTTEASPGADDDGNYLYESVPYPEEPARDEDLFAAPMLYYSVHEISDWFSELGLSGISNAPLVAITNMRTPNYDDAAALADPTAVLLPMDNAYFSPAYEWEGGSNPSSLVFGQGTESDLAYDADVIFHEFGHAVISTLDGPSGVWAGYYGIWVEPGAVSEALADYFSAARQGDPQVGEYAGLLWSPDGTGIRTLEGDHQCPRDITGEVHDDGMPLSAALWAARQSLDASLLDQAVYDGLAGSERTMGLADIAEQILLAVGDTLGESAQDTLLAEFVARGVMDCEPIRPIEPVDLETSVFDFAYLYGKDLWGAADPVPATLQWSYEVPDGYYEVTVRTFQVQTKGVPLVDYGRDLAPQPLVFYSRGGEAITHSYSSNAAGTLAIGTIADDTVEASATDTILENDRYFFYEYEAQFVVAGPATYYLQVANGGATSTYAVDLYMGFEETAAPEGTSFNYPDEGGCGGCGRSGDDEGSFAGLFVVMLALLPLARGGRRRSR